MEKRTEFFEALQAMEALELRDRLAFVNAMAGLKPGCGAGSYPLADGWLVDGGSEAPHLSVLIGTGAGKALSEPELDQVEAFFNGRQRTARAWVTHGINDTLREQLLAHGWEVEEEHPLCLYLLKRGETFPLPPDGVTVGPVNGEELQTYLQAAACCWLGIEHAEPDQLLIGKAFSANPGTTAILARVEGTPAATAMVSVEGDCAVFHGGCTLPGFRRRGVQAALIHERLRYAHEMGCRWAWVAGVKNGPTQRNAERLGFVREGFREVLIKT